MKRTSLRAVYKGSVKNDSRKKKLLNMAFDANETGSLQTGFIYDIDLDCGHTTQILATVKLPEALKLKYESIHEFLGDWSDINSL